MSQLDTYSVELFLPETDRKILFPVQATEYGDVWAFAENLACDMPEEDVYFDKSDRTSRTRWSASVDKVEEPEVEEKPKRLQFSTERFYGPEPQMIKAVEDGPHVLIHDSVRKLTYRILFCSLRPELILGYYDKGGNETISEAEFLEHWNQAEDI